MKLKLLFLIFLSCFFYHNAFAVDAGFRFIKTRGEVVCGTDLSSKNYAYKDENGFWHGIDADLCRVFSAAVFGRTDRFKLVDVKANQVNSAIANNKIDIMLGNAPSTASKDISGRTTQAAILYYDKLMFLAHAIDNASSMEAYKGKKVCTVANSENYYNLQNYSDKYNLDLKPLFFNNDQKAKEAFLLKRCDLYAGSELYLKGIYDGIGNYNLDVEMLPEIVAEKPVSAQVLRDNQKLRVAVKWIINALALAEQNGITSKNVDVFIGVKENSLKNLLGINPDLWSKFELNPDWVKIVLKELGNYGEIYDRNLGKDSKFKSERGKNNLIENGGLINAQVFF